MPALALSLTAHLGLGFALGIGTGSENGAITGNRSPATAFTVHFSKPVSIATRVDPKAGGNDKPAERSPDYPIDQPQAAQQLTEEEPLFPIFGQPEPRYFRPQELTGKPFILQDVSSDLALRLFGVPLQSVVLRLLINEQGDIDRVIIEDSDLPEQTERSVVEAFSRMKFYPGKIGATAVKTQLGIKVSIEEAGSVIKADRP